MDKELVKFIEWLPKHSNEFNGLSIEDTVDKINKLSTSEEGKELIKELTQKYKKSEMFKHGGMIEYLSFLKSGGKCSKKKITKHQNSSTMPEAPVLPDVEIEDEELDLSDNMPIDDTKYQLPIFLR